MSRVTVELWPGGRQSGKIEIATADIGRVRTDRLCDYEVDLHEDRLGAMGSSSVSQYPRWSASIWDLVLRAIAVGLTGSETLPERPVYPRGCAMCTSPKCRS